MQARFAQEAGLQRTQNGALQEPPPFFLAIPQTKPSCLMALWIMIGMQLSIFIKETCVF